jgi:2-hydroxychromene-2-carboxylate isomerase
MPAPLETRFIEFWFDFTSPYAYIASEQVEALAARTDRALSWKPFLLGAVFQVTGGAPLTSQHPSKAKYSLRDFARTAAFVGVAYAQPAKFPVGSVTAARAVLWLQREESAQLAPFIHAVFRAYFAQGRDIGDAATVLEIAADCGIDATALADGVKDEAIKAALKSQVDVAVSRGVFGVPTTFVDGEMFWGHDRLAQVERWIAKGPF